MAEVAEEAEGVRGGGEREQERGRPAEERRDRPGEQSANPTEAAACTGAAFELCKTFRRESPAEKHGEEEQYDAADLAAKY